MTKEELEKELYELKIFSGIQEYNALQYIKELEDENLELKKKIWEMENEKIQSNNRTRIRSGN